LEPADALQQAVLADGRFGREELEGEAFAFFVYYLAYLHAKGPSPACLRPKTAVIIQARRAEIKLCRLRLPKTELDTITD
jgi:hypothetical protein